MTKDHGDCSHKEVVSSTLSHAATATKPVRISFRTQCHNLKIKKKVYK